MLQYQNTYFFRGTTTAPETNVDCYEKAEIQTGKNPDGSAIKVEGWKRKSVIANVAIDLGVVPDSVEALCVLDSAHTYIKSQFVDKFLTPPEALDLAAFRTWLEGDGSGGGSGSVRIAKEVITAVLDALSVFIQESTGKAPLAASTAYAVRQGFSKIALMSEKGFNCPSSKLTVLWDQISTMLAKFKEAAADDSVNAVVDMWQEKIASHKTAFIELEEKDFAIAF